MKTLLTCCLIMGTVFASRQAAAQGLESKELKSFDSAFRAISKKTKTTILAEGKPLHPLLSDSQLARLNIPLGDTTAATLGALIPRLAAAFDYDAEQTNAHTFLLHKRYSDPMDLPCVTYEEIVHGIRETMRITDMFYSHDARYTHNSNQIRFAMSLSPDQLHAAGHGIHLSDLSPKQQTLAMNATLELSLAHKTAELEDCLHRLVVLNDPKTVFVWLHRDDRDALGYQGAFGYNENRGDVPLTNGFTSQLGRYNMTPPAIDKATFMPGTDPTAPTDLDRELLSADGNGISSFHTLQEAVRLGGDSSEPVTPGTHVTVDAAIAAKPVSVFGDQFSTRDHLVRSLSRLYGLQLLVPREGIYTVTLPTARTINDINDLPEAVKRLVPLPLTQSFAGQTARTIMNFPLSKPPSPRILYWEATVVDGKPLPKTEKEKTALAKNMAIDAYYYPAVRRLVALAKPFVPTPQSPPVSINAVGPEAKRLLAITLLSGFPTQQWDDLVNWQIPKYLSQPDTLAMQVGFQPGHKLIFTMGTTNPATGEVINDLGAQYNIGTP